jgi:ketosteroid isomerase-like protein
MISRYYFFIFLFSSSLLVLSCGTANTDTKDNLAEQKLELMDVDRSFSEMSNLKGMKQAFVEFIDSNGVLLRPANLPIIGANAIDYLIQQNDANYSLTWNPVHAEVAASGDLGYTFGEYAMQFHNSENVQSKDTIIYGTYVSVWKRQQDKKWKLMLHTANEGLGE